MCKRTKRILKNTISAILVSVIVPTILFAILSFIVNIVYIETNVVGFSMLPTFNKTVANEEIDGDTIYINKVRKLKRNSVVVAEVDWNEKPIIKRLVGLPGDEIEIKESSESYLLCVNGEVLIIKKKTSYSEDLYYGGTNLYFESYKNYLKTNNIEKIILKENEYFVMGDNWGRTTDSMRHGPVAREDIIGTVDFCEEYGKNENWFVLKQAFKSIFQF